MTSRSIRAAHSELTLTVVLTDGRIQVNNDSRLVWTGDIAHPSQESSNSWCDQPYPRPDDVSIVRNRYLIPPLDALCSGIFTAATLNRLPSLSHSHAPVPC